MKMEINIPNSLYANLKSISYGSIASRRILDCVKAGKRLTEVTNKGEWIVSKDKKQLICPFCKTHTKHRGDEIKLIGTAFFGIKFCEECGADLRGDIE